MVDAYLDNCLSIEVNNDNAFKEKSRIAHVAATTLCKMNSIMKQMRNWRDDRMKLRSNIWRLKLALRVAARNTDDTLHAVRLIEHQRAEIRRLETVNKDLKKEIADIKSALLNGDYVTRETARKSDDKIVEVKQEYLVERERLNNEIQYLKSRLNEVEEGHEHSSEVEHLKCKLKHFMMVDYTMEIIFTDIVNKVAETIANLSEELVNVNDRLRKSQTKNDNLYVEINKLKAVIRYRNGNLTDYRKRIVELDNLTKRLKTELNRFKVNDGNNSWNIDSNSQNNLNNIERLAKYLRNKLKNNHEALLAGGDPDCLKYIQKIIELSVNLKQLHIGFAKFSDQLNPLSLGKVMKSNEYLKQLATLDSTLKEIDVEIDKLKNNHINNHYRIGGSDGLEYLIKIKELETIIEKTRSTMNRLNRRAEGNSNESKDLEELENFVGRVCHEIKQLEVIVVSSDRLSTFKRIDQLEGLIVRLKSELNEKDAHINVLDQELFGTENLLEQKRKELEHTQKEIAMLMEDNKISKLRMKMMEEKALELQRDQEDSRKELVQLQKVEHEASLTRKKLQNLQSDKERLLKEMGKIRDAVQKKSEEARGVLIERNTMEKALNAKITDLTRNLQITLKENKKLKENENAKRSEEAMERMNAELQQLKVDLAISNENFDNANREIVDLKVKLHHFSDAKTKLETNIFHLESEKEVLVYQLGAEKATADERLKEFTNLKSDYNELDIKRANLEKEKEQLNANLTNIKIEKELLEKSVNHVRTKCNMLEDKIDKYKYERDSLLEEIRNFRTSNEHLSNKLEVTQTESNRTGDKIKQLEFENSKLHDDLNELTLKKISFEDRVQTLLLEKNQLATRINELDKNDVTLNNLLNQVKTVNEQQSIVELNKLKADYSKMRSENMTLQTTLDEVRQNNETLRKATEELNLRLNEIHSECKILENQLQILEVMNATLKKEKQLLEQEYTTSLRSKISNMEKEETVAYSESIFSQQNEQIVERATRKAVNSKSGKRLNDKIKLMEVKEELKKVIVENESLRFEVLNLRSQNFEVKMQLACTKDELRKQKTELVENETNGIVFKPISNKLEIVNLYYKEINSYLSHDMNNTNAVTRINQPGICPYDRSTTEQAGTQIEKLMEIANKLKVQNIALKMEINSLRCSLVVNFTKDEKRKEELRIATEEIQALKTELTTLRDEKESLRVRLDIANSKLDRLESEKTALKNELCALRKINSGLKHKTSELHCAYQKLKEKSVEFESCIMRAINKIKRYTMSADNLDDPSDLKNLLKKYISSEEILYSIEQRINIEDTYKNFKMM
ncbi:uncharacterized protein PFB0145c-like [Bombus impatiens]|uniref:Uncharacterized protein PFB0145c-like n=1 Tax=Bombus impatiens TaxID=132113 RepID=A0A6P8KZR6_BOMIM|nr:uncharacterized protein PFB0145c-like [Bombus impatiens]